MAVTTKYVLYFQTAGGAWILQTLLAVFMAIWFRWLDRWARIAGWAVGIGWTTYVGITSTSGCRTDTKLLNHHRVRPDSDLRMSEKLRQFECRKSLWVPTGVRSTAIFY